MEEILDTACVMARSFTDASSGYLALHPEAGVALFFVLCFLVANIWGLLASWLRSGKKTLTAKSEGAGHSPVRPASNADKPAVVSGAVEYKARANTLIGTVLFQNTGDIGKLGEELCHCYFQGQKSRIYEKLRSKINRTQGIDMVYRRVPKRGRSSIIVVESKVNSSPYQPEQLSDAGIKTRCRRMIDTGKSHLAETAELVLDAVSTDGLYILKRLLMHHDLCAGVLTIVSVDEHGQKVSGTQKVVDVSRRLRVRLEKRIENGRYALPAGEREKAFHKSYMNAVANKMSLLQLSYQLGMSYEEATDRVNALRGSGVSLPPLKSPVFVDDLD